FILHRIITNQGKSICRINGKLVTLAILREFGRTIIDIHSQHETQLLMDTNNHLTLLDQYCSVELDKTKKEYLSLFNTYDQLRRTHKELSTDEQQLAHRLDLLQFQMKELETANLQPEEDEILEKERAYLINFEKIFLGVQEA